MSFYSLSSYSQLRVNQSALDGGSTPSFSNTKSILLDGVDDYVDCGTGLGASLGSTYAGDQTISLWYKRTSSRVENLFNIGSAAAYGNGASLIFINNNLICGLRYANRAQYTTTFDTNWHHALYSVKNNGDATFTLKLFLDGTEVINTTVSIGYSVLNFTNNTTQIGKAGTYEFDGNIDEVAFWDSDQSANASTIYNSGVPSSLSTYSPLTWWRCGDGDTAPILTDNGSLGNDGTMTNFSAFSTDVPTASSFSNTKSILLDGIDDFCETASTYSELDGQTKATFSLWVKPSSFSSNPILSFLTNSTNQGSFVYRIIVNTNGQVNFQIGNFFVGANTGTNVLTANVWSHLLFAYDGSLSSGSRVKIFINGVDRTSSDNNTSTSLGNATYPLQVGRKNIGSGLNYNGNLDEFAIWSGTDLRASVSEIYASGSVVDLNTLATAPNPTTWYRMGDGDTAPTIQDTNGSANLTMENFTTFSTDVPT